MNTPANTFRFRPEPVSAIAVVCFSVLLVLSTVFPSPGRAAEGAAPAPNSEHGRQLFAKRCGGCHALDSDKEGPRLRNVYGRKAGSVTGFKYSDALKASSVVWSEASLDKWLTDTNSLVPDNDMEFHVPDPAERADIIRFLKVSSGQ